MNLSVDLQNSFECSVNNVLQFVGESWILANLPKINKKVLVEVSEYLLTFFAICLVSSREFKPKLTGTNFFSFEFTKNKIPKDSTTKSLFRKGIESGCQAFIVAENIFAEFLDDFHKAHDDSIQAFHNKHVVVYQSEVESGEVPDFHSSAALQGEKS